MTDRLTQWQHRLTHVCAPLSYPDQQELLAFAITQSRYATSLFDHAKQLGGELATTTDERDHLQARMTNWQTCATELQTERQHLRAGLDAAADYLATDDDVTDAEIICGHTSPQGANCERPADHDGPHEGHVGRYVVWEGDPKPASNPTGDGLFGACCQHEQGCAEAGCTCFCHGGVRP